MAQWDYDFAIFPPGERLIQLKRMGQAGWELVAIVGPDDNHFWFKRPVTASRVVEPAEEAEQPSRSYVEPDPPPPAETLYLAVKREEEDKMLTIMSDAGYYIRNITTDRVVIGSQLGIIFTKRQK